jgi:hypothetical protein
LSELRHEVWEIDTMDMTLAISLIVIAWGCGWAMGRGTRPSVPAPPLAPPDPAALEMARRVLMDEGQIAAIKLYREQTGTGLREAKLAVDTLRA